MKRTSSIFFAIAALILVSSALFASDSHSAIAQPALRVCGLTKYVNNPVLPKGSGEAWDNQLVREPSVIYEAGLYKMWYVGYGGSAYQIGYATSPDGITWTKSGNPVLSPTAAWETARLYAPTVINDNGTYKMWYTGRDSNFIRRIGYATSPDGITWTKYDNPVLDVGTAGSWDDRNVMEPSVIKYNGVYHMWHTGYDGVFNRIGHATSADGITWIKDAANPVIGLGAPSTWDWANAYSPAVISINDQLMMWYSGKSLPMEWPTGYATSSDGSVWARGEMVIPEGEVGTFDSDSADYVTVLVEGTQFKIWYSGLDSNNNYSIGYATAELCATSPIPSPTSHIYLPLLTRNWPAPTCQTYYAEDFSDTTSGWPTRDDANQTSGYLDGGYQILIKNSNYWSANTPSANAADFTVLVTGLQTTANVGAYGPLFGINEDWSQFYVFLVGDQYFSLWRYDNGWTPLQNWASSGYINAAPSPNRIKLIRQGNTIYAYVNNQLLTSSTDSSFIDVRRIGLFAESFTDTSIDARFDDFALYSANCGTSVNRPSNSEMVNHGAPISPPPHP